MKRDKVKDRDINIDGKERCFSFFILYSFSFILYGKFLGEVYLGVRLWNGNVFVLSIIVMCGWYGNYRWGIMFMRFFYV